MFGAPPITNDRLIKIPPKRYVQRLNAFSRGYAISSAPTMSGTIKLPTPTLIGIIAKKIIVVACIVNI